MPSDSTVRVSVRPKPLRDLFSKYAPQAGASPQTVRPLGVVRRPDSGQSGKNITTEQELSDLERVYLYLTGGGMDGNKVPYLASAKCLAEVLESAKTQRNLPRLSKSQTFEHQYKLAVSRDGHSTPRTATKAKPKRLITLPMYQVKVNVNTMEIEDSQAVESTRKSLRNLMEVGKIKASHPDNGVSANIKNFPFRNLIRSPDFESTRSLQSKPSKFTEVKLESGTSMCNPSTSVSDGKSKELSNQNFNSNETHWSGNKMAPDVKSSYTEQTDDKSRTETDIDRLEVRFDSVAYTPTDVNRSPNSRAKTRESYVTKGDTIGDKTVQTSPPPWLSSSSSRNYLNSVTPYNGDRALSGSMYRSPGSSGSLTSGQDWTNLRDIHKLKVEACRQASQARRQRKNNSKDTASSLGSSESTHLKPCPTLRYTQLPRNLVPLDPIIVPPDTHIACPMCNACSVPDTSSCPPNSPTQELEAVESGNINGTTSTEKHFIRVPCGDIYPDTRSEASTDFWENNESNERLSNTDKVENQTPSECERQQIQRPHTSSSQNSLYDVLIMPKVSMKYYPQ